MTLLAVLSIILVLCTIAFLTYGRENTWRLIAGNPDQGAIELQSVQRNKQPNDALLCTSPLCESDAKVDKVLPAYELSASEIIQAIDKEIRQSGALFERVDDLSDPKQARFVIRTNIMRFPDTIQFQAIAMDNGKTGLIAYGRAQLGQSDIGVNFQRLISLTKNLKLPQLKPH